MKKTTLLVMFGTALVFMLGCPAKVPDEPPKMDDAAVPATNSAMNSAADAGKVAQPLDLGTSDKPDVADQ